MQSFICLCRSSYHFLQWILTWTPVFNDNFCRFPQSHWASFSLNILPPISIKAMLFCFIWLLYIDNQLTLPVYHYLTTRPWSKSRHVLCWTSLFGNRSHLLFLLIWSSLSLSLSEKSTINSLKTFPQIILNTNWKQWLTVAYLNITFQWRLQCHIFCTLYSLIWLQ